jgi:molecular chaperone DnaK
MSSPIDDTVLPPSRRRASSAGMDGDTLLPSQNSVGFHALGDVIDNRYTVVREIGRGGMGVVYEVEDSVIRGRVAIKRLLPDLAMRTDLIDVFVREGVNALKFSSESPRFVTMRHVGADVHGHYLVMDYIGAPTLRTALNNAVNQRFVCGEAMHVFKELASALADLHRYGFVHRDLKPENVFVGKSGNDIKVKLVDFGLTKEDTESTRTSLRGAGTTGYTSPEQRKGLPSTPATDVYAFGVIAYEMLCGELPIVGDVISDYVDGVPDSLCDLVMRCLASRVERRPSDGKALLDCLHQCENRKPVSNSHEQREDTTLVNRSTVRLTSVPLGATVRFDNRVVSGDVHTISFPGVSHNLSVGISCNGYEDFARHITLKSDEHTTLDVSLVRISSKAANGAVGSTSGQTKSARPKAIKHSLGIDLGTSKCVISVFDGKTAVVIPNAEGEMVTPSVVAFQKSGNVLVGTPAKRQAVVNPTRTIFSSKRYIGTDQVTRIDGVAYTPVDFAALLLKKVKADAEDYVGETFSTAVVTVPAYFNDSQRIATKTAAEIAGLEVLRIINEPTAAALAYGVNSKTSETILVYDFGGGTFDVTILDINDGTFDVRATCGDTFLGGNDFDQKIVDFLLDSFRKSDGVDLRQDLQAMQRLREAAVQAKIELSTATSTNINIPFLHMRHNGPAHLALSFSRTQFDVMTANLIDRTVDIVRQALQDAQLQTTSVMDVLLVGGTSRIPAVQHRIFDLFKREPNKRINPEEAVARGAAIQAGMLRGFAPDLKLFDVSSSSLGIKTLGGVMTRLIERNTKIPTSFTEVFSTAAEGQTSVCVQVYQGESDRVADNRLLGDFELIGIVPAPRGVPKIAVKFSIDANGILSVDATDEGTGKKMGITIDKPVRSS